MTDECIIIVTPNEGRLIALLRQQSSCPEWAVEHLSVGDVVIRKKSSGAPCFVIERKTPEDLWSSIIDPKKRYVTQRDHLAEVKKETECTIVYIIEGAIPCRHAKEIRGCLYSLQANHGYVVLQTTAMDDTVAALFFLYQKATEVKYTAGDVPGRVNSLKLTPKDDVRLDMWYHYSLMIIPGISLEKARSVASVFPTIDDLLEEVRRQDTTQLANVMVGRRKLGPSLAGKIVQCIQCALRSTPQP